MSSSYKWQAIPVWRRWLGFLASLGFIGMGIQWTIDAWKGGNWVLVPFAVALGLWGVLLLVGIICNVLDV